MNDIGINLYCVGRYIWVNQSIDLGISHGIKNHTNLV